MLRLVKPNYKYRKSFLSALKEFGDEPKAGIFYESMALKNFNTFLKRIRNDEKGIDLPKNWVIASTFWLVQDNTFIGSLSLRHRLTSRLKQYGGNIGYSIRPSKRNKGYGTHMLTLALKRTKKIGIKKVLITCDNDNVGSQKIIQANGGILHDTINTKYNPNKKPIMRWWIEL